jgi:small subunit ribosomal protein S16
MGSKKRPFYRLIAADSRKPRDGRFIETLGYYDPIPTPAEVRVNEESVFKWLERGAIPTTSARSLLRQLGYIQKWQLMKQGVTGEELAARSEAIVAQQQKASAKRESAKQGIMSDKAAAKHAEESKKAEESAAAEPVEAKPAEDAAPSAEPAEAKPAEEAAPAAEPAEAAAPAEESAEAGGDAPDSDADSEKTKE